MPTMMLQRQHDAGGPLRRVKVLVDGHERAVLRRGREVWIAVEPGPHVVQAHFDGTPSDDVLVAVRERDVVRCQVAVAADASWLAWSHPVVVELNVF